MEPASGSSVTNWQSALPEQCSQVRDIGNDAVWSLSSCKAGYGVDKLLDNNADTYWQSDGPQPHIVNVQFNRKTPMAFFALFVDYKVDESYTPSRISIRIGSHTDDLREIRQKELMEPVGWQLIDLRDSAGQPIRAFMLQLAIQQNHQNGRDTHVRQMKVLGPNVDITDSMHTVILPSGTPLAHSKPTQLAFTQFATIR